MSYYCTTNILHEQGLISQFQPLVFKFPVEWHHQSLTQMDRLETSESPLTLPASPSKSSWSPSAVDSTSQKPYAGCPLHFPTISLFRAFMLSYLAYGTGLWPSFSMSHFTCCLVCLSKTRQIIPMPKILCFTQRIKARPFNVTCMHSHLMLTHCISLISSPCPLLILCPRHTTHIRGLSRLHSVVSAAPSAWNAFPSWTSPLTH